MDDDERRGLVRGLAELAGYETTNRAIDQVLRRAERLGTAELNKIWAQNREAPHTLARRDKLAMSLRFIENAKGIEHVERSGGVEL